MLITTTNILKGVIPTVSNGSSDDDPTSVVNEDFSLNYTSSDNNSLIFDFGLTGEINYVAVGGILVKGFGDNTSYVEILNNGVSISLHNAKRDHCFLISFDAMSFSNLQIKLFNAAGNLPPTLSYAAAGVTLTVPNGGEIGGYDRQWAKRNLKAKTTTNNLAAPISTLKKRFPSKGTLSIPNVLRSFSDDTWQDFLDFGVDNIFFINEATENPQYSYVCHELENSITRAHGQTRALNNLSIKFKVYNGL